MSESIPFNPRFHVLSQLWQLSLEPIGSVLGTTSYWKYTQITEDKTAWNNIFFKLFSYLSHIY